MMGTRTVGVGLRMTWRKHPTSNGVIGNATATGTHSARAMKLWDKEKVPNALDIKPVSKCPSKVIFVASPKKKRLMPENKHPWTVTAKISGNEFTDLLLDSGAEMSVVSSEAVPKDCYTGQRSEARGLVPTVTSFDIARVHIEIDSVGCIGGASRHHQIYGIVRKRCPWPGSINQTPSAGDIASADESPATTSRTD